MDSQIIGAIVTSVLGGGLATTYAGYRKDKRLAPTNSELRTDASVVLMKKSGEALSETIHTLQEQMQEMQERHEREMLAQATRHSKERAEWLEDRERFKTEILELRESLEKTASRLAALQGRLEG